MYKAAEMYEDCEELEKVLEHIDYLEKLSGKSLFYCQALAQFFSRQLQIALSKDVDLNSLETYRPGA